jgi:hypothetical protein
MANNTRRRSNPLTAVQRVLDNDRYALTLPILGSIDLPRPQELAYYGGLAALAAVEIIEWPIALILATGHALAHNHTSLVARELGEALDEA